VGRCKCRRIIAHYIIDHRKRPVAAQLRLDNVSKSFGVGGATETHAIDRITLDVDEGEFLAVVGPSGCGKSTLLQIAAALLPPTSGVVTLDGQAFTAPPPSMVYLFQQYAKSLFPWRTVVDNVAFAVEHHDGMSRDKAREHSRRFLEMVGLAEFSDRFPRQLSGGMQQRVAIARALAAEPRVLLMDEPFSSVDALTRLELHALVQDLREKQRFTAVLVTHDVDEAVFLADRVVVLSARPSTVVRSVAIELPRPRDSLATREDPRFLELRHELLEMLLKKPVAVNADG
jgi:NitT/TauT family transport system ATP-binding protein